MYKNLGIHWASSLPGFLALACLPFPFLFYKYGASIRKKCKYAAQSEAFMEKMRLQAARRNGADADSTDSDSSRTRAEATAEQEVIDYSYEDEKEPQGRFQTMRTAKETEGAELQKVKTGRSTRSKRSVRTAREEYYDNPYEIDRVNTRESFKRPRGESVSSKIMPIKSRQ